MILNAFYLQNRSQLKRKEPPVQEAENNISPTIEQMSSQTPLVKYHGFQSTWDPVKIHSQTLFVLATKAANKVHFIFINQNYLFVLFNLILSLIQAVQVICIYVTERSYGQ